MVDGVVFLPGPTVAIEILEKEPTRVALIEVCLLARIATRVTPTNDVRDQFIFMSLRNTEYTLFTVSSPEPLAMQSATQKYPSTPSKIASSMHPLTLSENPRPAVWPIIRSECNTPTDLGADHLALASNVAVPHHAHALVSRVHGEPDPGGRICGRLHALRGAEGDGLGGAGALSPGVEDESGDGVLGMNEGCGGEECDGCCCGEGLGEEEHLWNWSW